MTLGSLVGRRREAGEGTGGADLGIHGSLVSALHASDERFRHSVDGTRDLARRLLAPREG